MPLFPTRARCHTGPNDKPLQRLALPLSLFTNLFGERFDFRNGVEGRGGGRHEAPCGGESVDDGGWLGAEVVRAGVRAVQVEDVLSFEQERRCYSKESSQSWVVDAGSAWSLYRECTEQRRKGGLDEWLRARLVEYKIDEYNSHATDVIKIERRQNAPQPQQSNPPLKTHSPTPPSSSPRSRVVARATARRLGRVTPGRLG